MKRGKDLPAGEQGEWLIEQLFAEKGYLACAVQAQFPPEEVLMRISFIAAGLLVLVRSNPGKYSFSSCGTE